MFYDMVQIHRSGTTDSDIPSVDAVTDWFATTAAWRLTMYSFLNTDILNTQFIDLKTI